MMHRAAWLLFLLLLAGCRYVGAPMPQVTPERPQLLQAGAGSDPTRQSSLPERRCVVACSAGTRCDERTGACEAAPAPAATRDGGVPWLP